MLTYIIYFFALIIFSYVVYLSIKAINTGLKAKKNQIKKINLKF